jgi:non-heme chloroperoxidase
MKDLEKTPSTGIDKCAPTRRDVLLGGAAILASMGLPTDILASPTAIASRAGSPSPDEGASLMSYVTTKDGTEIFYKDWGSGQPIVFHHGWPLSSDDWDTQMLFFVHHGYRVIGIDRRGHGRSEQVSEGHDMDHYAADAAAVVEHLDLHDTVHIGHSTGGGEAARYVARHGKGRVAKLVLVAAVPPIMVKSPNNPDGLPISVFDGFRASLAANRAEFYREVASKPFYGFNRPDNKPLEGVVENWWRQGMMGGAKAHYDGIKAFSETDLTEDLKSIEVPTLVLQGDDDQIVPYKGAALLQEKLLKKPTVKIYPGFPHGMLTTYADRVNPDLLEFVRS